MKRPRKSAHFVMPSYGTNEIRNETTEDSVRDDIELQDNFLNTDEETHAAEGEILQEEQEEQVKGK